MDNQTEPVITQQRIANSYTLVIGSPYELISLFRDRIYRATDSLYGRVLDDVLGKEVFLAEPSKKVEIGENRRGLKYGDDGSAIITKSIRLIQPVRHIQKEVADELGPLIWNRRYIGKVEITISSRDAEHFKRLERKIQEGMPVVWNETFDPVMEYLKEHRGSVQFDIVHALSQSRN